MADLIPKLEAELSELAGGGKSFVLRVIQPGLAGLMDGSVSTLAPICLLYTSRCV